MCGRNIFLKKIVVFFVLKKINVSYKKWSKVIMEIDQHKLYFSA